MGVCIPLSGLDCPPATTNYSRGDTCAAWTRVDVNVDMDVDDTLTTLTRNSKAKGNFWYS